MDSNEYIFRNRQMKARLYDAGMTHTADRYTVFLHYPKLVTQGILNHTGRKILGMGIKCAQDNHGKMIITNVVDWEEHQGSPSMRNGQRIQLSDMPKPFQDRVNCIERAFTQSAKDGIWNRVIETIQQQ